jgi:hypothetical protein
LTIKALKARRAGALRRASLIFGGVTKIYPSKLALAPACLVVLGLPKMGVSRIITLIVKFHALFAVFGVMPLPVTFETFNF